MGGERTRTLGQPARQKRLNLSGYRSVHYPTSPPPTPTHPPIHVGMPKAEAVPRLMHCVIHGGEALCDHSALQGWAGGGGMSLAKRSRERLAPKPSATALWPEGCRGPATAPTPAHPSQKLALPLPRTHPGSPPAAPGTEGRHSVLSQGDKHQVHPRRDASGGQGLWRRVAREGGSVAGEPDESRQHTLDRRSPMPYQPPAATTHRNAAQAPVQRTSTAGVS